MPLKPHYRMTLVLDRRDPLLCSRVNAEPLLSEYIKSLIRLDMDFPEGLRCEHENSFPMSEDDSPVNTTIRFYFDRDADIIQRLKEVGRSASYVKELIYWSIGLDPLKTVSEERRKKGNRHGVRSSCPSFKIHDN